MYLDWALDAATRSVFSAQALRPDMTLSALGINIYRGDGDSQLQRWSSIIGIVTAIIGNILISFALNIQRYAHIRLHEERAHRREKLKSIPKSAGGYGTVGTNGHHVNELNGQEGEEDSPLTKSQSAPCSDEDHDEDSNYLRSPYWWGGIFLMTIGEAGNFLAYGFAPASIVSPLGVVALISNCVIAPVMLKEHFRMRDFWGVVVAVGGAVTVVLSAKQQEKKLGPHEILGAITATAFEVYMGITIALIGILMWASPKYGNKTVMIDLGLVGLFGGYTALSTKGVASMLSSTLWRALATPVTYALLVVLVGTAIFQVKYVNRALQRFDSTQVIPVQFVMFTLSVIIGSAVLYRDFEKVTAENMAKFVGGCLLTFFGVWLITSARPRLEDDEEEESDEEGEERIRLADQEAASGETQGIQYDTVRKPGLTPNGDAAYDESDSESRRSSRVSFVEPSPRPAYSNLSYQPSLRVPLSVPPSEQGGEETPLMGNPWKNTSEELLQAARHPGFATTSSSPLLPSEAQTPSTDSLKPPQERSTSHRNFNTHPNHQTGPTPPQADRPTTPAFHSISRMMPGPLLSPLSGGLSAVVADSLRRGVDSPNRRFKRARLSLHRTKSGSQRLSSGDVGGDDDLGTSPTKDRPQSQVFSKSLDTEGASNWSRITRARSLSNTLGDLFRTKRQKTDRPDTSGDEEAGPSDP